MSDVDESYREKCFRVHGRQCALCGVVEDVVAHHRDGNRDNDDKSNLLPVCLSCHRQIHWGSVENLSDELPDSSRHDLPKLPTSGVRPHMKISYTMEGRVKDYADDHDMDTSEAYREIIEAGLEELEDES